MGCFLIYITGSQPDVSLSYFPWGTCSPTCSNNGLRFFLQWWWFFKSYRQVPYLAYLLWCCNFVLVYFPADQVPLKLKSSVFTNILLCNILKLFPSIWTGPQICCWDISTFYTLEMCYPEWLMEIISAPGSKTMLSEREKRVYMETRVYSPLLGPAEMLSPLPPRCVSHHSTRVCQNMFPQPFNPFSTACNLPGYFCVLHSMIKCPGLW